MTHRIDHDTASLETDWRRQAEQLDLVMQATNEGLWDWDMRSNEITFSHRWKAMLGYEADEIEPRFDEWERRVHPTDLERVQDAINAYVRGATPVYEVEHRMRHKDGSWRWICARGVVVRDGAGEPIRFVGSHADISERRATEQALKRSRRKYERLVNAINGILWEIDIATMDLVFISDEAERALGYPVERWTSEPDFWSQCVHDDDRERVLQELKTVSAETPTLELEYRMIAADGRLLWFRDLVTVILQHERPVSLRGVMVDITQQKAAEEELRRRDAILEAVRFAGERFLSPTVSWDENINQVLERLGRAAEASRVYIFENYTGPDGEVWATNTHEWVSSPELSVIDLPQLRAMSYREIGFGRWIDLFPRGEIVHGCVRDLPEAERREMESEGTLAIVLVPIIVGDEWWGFIGFDDCVQEREPTQPVCDALKAAADMLGAAMGRERELHRRDAVLNAVRFAGERFLSHTSGWEESIDQVLERLGRATDVTRVHLFENHTGPDGEVRARNTHEWVADASMSVIDLPRLREMSYSSMGFGRWVDIFRRGEMIYSHVRDLPELERKELEAEQILSIALVPIFVDGEWWGFIGFDECVKRRRASAMERDALKAAADTLGAAIGRRRTDEELRENQRSMQTLLSNLPGMAYRISPDRNSSHPGTGIGPDVISEGALDLTGYSPSTLAGGDGFSYTDIIDPADKVAMRDDIDHAIQTRHPYHLTYRITTASGETKWVMEQGRPIESDAGDVVALEGIIMDITERVRASEQLRESQRSMQTLLSNLPGMAYRSQPGSPWRIDFVSEGAIELTGHHPDTLAGNDTFSFVDIIHPDDRGVIRHDIEAAMIARRSYHLTYRITTASGDERWVMEQGRPVENDDGTVVALEGIIMDVTDRIHSRRLLEQRVEERTRELGTLLSISTGVASTLELEPLLGVILDQLRQVVEHVAAAIFTLDGDGTLQMLDYRGPTNRTQLEWVWPLTDAAHSRQVIDSCAPVIIPDVHADTPMAHAFREKAINDLGEVPDYIASWMGVPLMVRDRAIGLLAVDSSELNAYTTHHAELALAFASQAAVAIENARLYEAAQGTAALQERQRLARELHDSVSQALFGIGLGARTARTLIEQDPAKAIPPLDYVLSLAEAGLAEMRALIFELRPEALGEEGLVAALTKQIAALESRYDIHVDADIPQNIEVAPAVQEAIYRIGQEALHNIVKHARASSVMLTLSSDPGATRLRIVDNGIGFDTSGSFPGHLGLKSMSERAEKLGGTFRIESAMGEGSTVEVSIPSHPRG